MLETLLRSTEGSVAERGVRPTRSTSGGPGPSLGELVGAVTGERRDSVRVCEPWKTRRPLAEILVPALAAARRLLRCSSSRLRRSCETDELPTELRLCSRRCGLELSGVVESDVRSGIICSA